MDTELRSQVTALVEVAVLGDQVESFMRSDIGLYLLGYAHAEAAEAIRALKVADPSNVERVRSLQNEVYRAESIKGWLERAIVAGAKAKIVLEDREGE